MIDYFCYAILVSGRVLDLSSLCQPKPQPVAIQLQAPTPKPSAVPTATPAIDYKRIAENYGQYLCGGRLYPETALQNAIIMNGVQPKDFDPPGQFQTWVDSYLRRWCKPVNR